METKLTTEILQSYLSFGLECETTIDHLPEKKIGILASLTTKDAYESCNLVFPKHEVEEGIGLFHLEEIKPTLHPLSSLTKTITHEGKEIVPIVELYKIARGRFEDSVVRYFDIASTFSVFIEMEGHRNYRFALNKSDSDVRLEPCYHFNLFSTDLNGNCKQEITVQCQNILFQKLFQWHFDVFGLIDSNLAIPKE